MFVEMCVMDRVKLLHNFHIANNQKGFVATEKYRGFVEGHAMCVFYPFCYGHLVLPVSEPRDKLESMT